MYMKKNIVYQGFVLCMVLGAQWGSWKLFLVDNRGLLYIEFW